MLKLSCKSPVDINKLFTRKSDLHTLISSQNISYLSVGLKGPRDSEGPRDLVRGPRVTPEGVEPRVDVTQSVPQLFQGQLPPSHSSHNYTGPG